eukprot:CAMPEP_0182872992 /NCGR_PEP_ID=MMETSP0034_2-20130328/12057_1 /TAXON_ID=156128 /ORGANISM="Nephroselmis pyriformis, Strain CCMP717" /LENGTH=191 /DNA_ID=CAMNT_0025005615 /DNA_START=49 /DNA_END=621 /DNA_ORIENTATION=-
MAAAAAAMAEDPPLPGWVLSRTPSGSAEEVMWEGGQGAFPGSWLQLTREDLQGIGISQARPLLWDGAKYRPDPEGGGFRLTQHVLDRSPGTLALRDAVGRWEKEAEGWRGVDEGDRHMYTQICRGLASKLGALEDDVKQDYPSEVAAFWRRGELVSLVDSCVRTKTNTLILKYILACPQSQLPPAMRVRGS